MSQKTTQVKQGNHKRSATQVHKSESQRTVTDYFKGNKCKEGNNEVFTEVTGDKKKCKRRRTTGDKSTNKKLNQMEVENQIEETNEPAPPHSMELKKPDGTNNPKNPQLQKIPKEVDPQYAVLEQLFTTKMNNLVNDAITKALEPLKESIDNLNTKQTELQESIATLTRLESMIEEHTDSIKKLQSENLTIQTKLEKFENTQQHLVDKMIQLQNKQLEKNLVISGIPKMENERESIRIKKIKSIIMPIMSADSEDDKKKEADNIEIVSCKRIGKYMEGKHRPMSVEFHCKSDVDKIFNKKKELATGTYVDREYWAKTERRRRLLRPILKAARRLPEYTGLCKLDADVLVLNRKRFNIQNTDKLPEKLNPSKITSKTDNNIHGFFGELHPLSNFHPAPFFLDGKQFNSSEHYIQYQKALIFDDTTTAYRILVADTLLECKKLGYEISGFEYKTWKLNAGNLCKPGLLAKYLQNQKSRQALLNTENKTLAECTSDKLWGTGLLLSHPDCLVSSKWTRNCLLGKLLEEVRTGIRALNATMMETGD